MTRELSGYCIQEPVLVTLPQGNDCKGFLRCGRKGSFLVNCLQKKGNCRGCPRYGRQGYPGMFLVALSRDAGDRRGEKGK